MKSAGILDEVKSRLDIVEVLGDHVELKRAGRNFRALCPFHAEKTPSFMVSPEKQLFHCFGCGAGGDIVGFVMRHESVGFEEALQMLAKRAGVKYEPGGRGSSARSEKEPIRAVLGRALEFFREGLKGSAKARAYLKERGVAEETVSEFSLGYAQAGWRSLKGRLSSEGFSEALMLKAGVLARGDKGTYDLMRDRIIFPISDVGGDVIAFGGRVMDDSQPKYINSPETPLFRKSKTLYGLNLAREGIRKGGFAVLVEGYMDVMACRQHGIPNVVAPLGTALTAEHIRTLKRFTKKAVVVFDGDRAGISAAKRAVGVALSEDMLVKALPLPEGEDPDSLLKAKGAPYVEGLIKGALPVVEFLLKYADGERSEAVNGAIEVISTAKDPIVLGELVRELSYGARETEAAIRAKIKKLGKDAGKKEAGERPRGRAAGNKEEVLLLSAALAHPLKLKEIFGLIGLKDISDVEIRDVFEKMLSPGWDHRPESLLEALGKGGQALVSKVSLEPGFDPEGVDKAVGDCIRKIMKRHVDEKIRAAELSGDLRTLNRLLSERQKLMKERIDERQL